MGVVSDRKDLDTTIGADGMQKNYLVLSDEERAKGFVRPVRRSYRHVGIAGPQHPLRTLTTDERKMWEGDDDPFVAFETYPEGSPEKIRRPNSTGRYWTQSDLDKIAKGCGTVTTMGIAIAETYARNPHFYGSTFCVGCGVHLPVGEDGEFVWEPDCSRVGT